jgi:hypothetical protein
MAHTDFSSPARSITQVIVSYPPITPTRQADLLAQTPSRPEHVVHLSHLMHECHALRLLASASPRAWTALVFSSGTSIVYG